MAGFEPWISGIGSDCSTNCATTTAHLDKKCNEGSVKQYLFIFFCFINQPMLLVVAERSL